jgi:hypothetical protein
MSGVYTSGFAGFVPAEHPDLTAIVVIDQTPMFGATAAAPLFSIIGADALREFRIAPVPAQPPAPGVPLATPATAQAAGEVIAPVLSPARTSAPSTASTVAKSPPTTAATLPRRGAIASATTTSTSRPPHG